MELFLVITIGCIVGLSVFLIMQRNTLKMLLGLAMLSSVINIIILLCGRMNGHEPVFINPMTQHNFANPLPQALILTAIVIGFALLAYLCALIKQVLPLESPNNTDSIGPKQ